jgi:hypothetical protein
MEHRVSENLNLNFTIKMMSYCRVKYSERHKNSLMIKQHFFKRFNYEFAFKLLLHLSIFFVRSMNHKRDKLDKFAWIQCARITLKISNHLGI